MKIARLKIRNFRSYKNEMEIDFEDMTIFLGKNDAGKSTILEALDIFFNDSKWCVAISYDDVNKDNLRAWDDIVEMRVFLKDVSDEIVLETVPTSLAKEFLLNERGELEIFKQFSGKTMKMSTFIVAKHPSNDTFLRNLLLTKIDKLQSYVEENGIPVSWRKTVSCDLRSAIRSSYWELQYETQDIPVDKEGAKELWEKIKFVLPAYTLFQSDRSNTDQDNEVQSPMNVALQSILSEPEIALKLQEIFEEVKRKTESVAEWTLEMLRSINSELADTLYPKAPDFDKLAWNKAFPKTEIHSDSIPVNKRGSWVKRLILLSFFLNEVERRKREEGLTNIVYAFEEPETSQHPEHQRILVEAFRGLSKTAHAQVFLTTHSPYVYKDCILDSDIKLMHISGGNGEKSCVDVRGSYGLFPWSPSWWEINYHVYGLSTFEFMNELYGYIDETKAGSFSHVDDEFESNGILKEHQWVKMGWSSKPVTYITYLRHQLHHPENNANALDFRNRLGDAITDMLRCINARPV